MTNSNTRIHASIPTLDTERKSPFAGRGNWSPSNLNIFGHLINIDIPTGNLIISTTDVAYPYYDFSLGITRKYDLQEQNMQLTYQRNYPNVNPKPHWFGNWQFGFEADIDEVWLNSYPELHINSGVGANGLFEILKPDFHQHFTSADDLADLIKAYGIPKRTLNALNWHFSSNDFLLRTKRGFFQIITGHYQAETLVDDTEAKIWLFNPITGTAFYIGSDYYYNNVFNTNGKYRDVGSPLLVTKIVDALGHVITLKPNSSIQPYTSFTLSDNSLLPDRTNRRFSIELSQDYLFLDGLNRDQEVRKLLVKRVIDLSKDSDPRKSNFNAYIYNYGFNLFGSHEFPLLEQVDYPCSIGNSIRRIIYHYDNVDYPGIITAIEKVVDPNDSTKNSKIIFDYIEDIQDNDERLNPRLKIKKITIPEGIIFEYDYNYVKSEMIAKIYRQGSIDDNKQVKYQYIRDSNNTKKRYLTLTEIIVKRGYEIDSTGNCQPRSLNNPQIISGRNEYTKDGRYNILKSIDALNRITTYEYNDFNQVSKVTDFLNHWTEHIYSTNSAPRHYDLKKTRILNLIRRKDPYSGVITEHEEVIEAEYTYLKYNTVTVTDPLGEDNNILSTHRLWQETDERGKIWIFEYDDGNYHCPNNPTLVTTPRGFRTEVEYNDRGERTKVIDPEGNSHVYGYDPQGNITTYENPNNHFIKISYYPCGNWLHIFEDQLNNTTIIERDSDSKIKRIIDPEDDSVEFEYLKNDRLWKVIEHRPLIREDPSDSTSQPLIQEYTDLISEYYYTPIGYLSKFKNPKSQEIRFNYDESDRIYEWFLNIPVLKKTKFLYDSSGQLLRLINKSNEMIIYEYYPQGFLKSVGYPDWKSVDTNGNEVTIQGKKVSYQKYDFTGKILIVNDDEVGIYEYYYDKSSNLIYSMDPFGLNLEYDYNDDNQLYRIKNSINQTILDLEIDCLGRLKKLTDLETYWNYTYEKVDSGVKKVLNLYSIDNPTINLLTSFDYDEKNRIKTLTHSLTNPQSDFFNQTFAYRKDDLLKEILNDDSNSFSYDGIKQLIYEDLNNQVTDYDETGNRLFKRPLSDLPIPNSEHSSINEMNQIKIENALGMNFDYDVNGNIYSIQTPHQTDKFYYDEEENLRTYFPNDSTEVHYKYNYKGQLIERVTLDKTNTPPTEKKYTFSYLFNKPKIVYLSNNPYLNLTWDTDGRLLKVKRDTSLPTPPPNFPESLFALYNSLGDIIRYIDSNGTERIRLRYNSWGEIESINDPDLFEFWGYKGAFYDKLTGLILFGKRWYYPALGRWTSEDPKNQFKLSDYIDLINLNVYVRNDPINSFDPAGFTKIKMAHSMKDRWTKALDTISNKETWMKNVLEFLENAENIDIRLRYSPGSDRRAHRGGVTEITRKRINKDPIYRKYKYTAVVTLYQVNIDIYAKEAPGLTFDAVLFHEIFGHIWNANPYGEPISIEVAQDAVKFTIRPKFMTFEEEENAAINLENYYMSK